MSELDTFFLEMYDSGKKISEKIMLAFIWDGSVIWTADAGRWTQTVRTVTQIGDRYFMFEWERGLTEMQECACYKQPVEVMEVKVEKEIPAHTMIITDWRPIENGEKEKT